MIKNHPFIIFFFVLLFFLTLEVTAQQRIFYVDGSNSAANDSNPGSESLPWKTIPKAASTLTARQMVYIKAGSYSGSVRVAHSGTYDGFIIFSAYPGDEHKVIISGSRFEIIGKSFIKVSGLKIQNANNGIYVQGPCTDIILSGNHTFNTNSSGISVWGVPWRKDPTVYDYKAVKNLVLENNLVEKACNGGWNECITLSNGVFNFEIRGNHVFNGGDPTNGGEGIDVKEGCSNGRIYNNLVEDLERHGIYVDAGGHLDYTPPHCRNIDIFQNVVRRVAEGINIVSEGDGGVENIRVFNNLVYNVKKNGLLIYDHPHGAGPMKNVILLNNTVYQNDRDGIHINHSRAESLLVRNNISYLNAWTDFNPKVGNPAADHNLCGIDPQFVDVTNFDFHLISGSVAIDSGSCLRAPGYDFDNHVRPFGQGYDIGAYEYGAIDTVSIKYSLSVSQGAGTGEYQPYQWVRIIADDAPNGFEFDKWTGDTDDISDVTAPVTIVRMPEHDVAITATYKSLTLELPPGSGTGSILRKIWYNISGTEVADLTTHVNFPGKPDSVNVCTSFKAPVNIGDNYGTLMQGYLHPPLEGKYHFWIASDGTSELWLSTDQSPENKKKIAWVENWTDPEQWEKQSESYQMSKAVDLESGKKYYIEALQKEETGPNDNLSVAWQLEGYNRIVINGQYLSPWDETVGIAHKPVHTPHTTRLIGNYPNPFNPSTTIKYELSESANVSLIVYDVLGREIITLVNECQQRGIKTIIWDGMDKNKSSVTSGIYFYSMIIDDNIAYNGKMEILK